MVSESCKVLSVSESGYYRWFESVKKLRASDFLSVKIKDVLSRAPENDNYGAARMHLTIKQEGDNASYSTVYRVMKENGYLHKAKRYPNGITKED